VRLACLDDIEVLGVDFAVLGEIEVLLRNENALCGDRVSACPYMQHESREKVVVCAIAMAREENTNRGRGTCRIDVSVCFQLKPDIVGRGRQKLIAQCEFSKTCTSQLR
jgi:hypothetical protein